VISVRCLFYPGFSYAKVEFAWTVACSEDLKHATTDGERSNSWAADVFAAYFKQLWFAATVDEQVSLPSPRWESQAQGSSH